MYVALHDTHVQLTCGVHLPSHMLLRPATARHLGRLATNLAGQQARSRRTVILDQYYRTLAGLEELTSTRSKQSHVYARPATTLLHLSSQGNYIALGERSV